MSSYSSLAAVERTFQIIEILVEETQGVSVTELVNRTDLSKSMVSRILTTLREAGYVEQDSKTRHYKLSFGFMSMVYRHLNALDLEDIFYPLLERVSERTGELIQLAAVTQNGLFFIAKIEGIHPLKIASMLGQKAPYHATAVGKAWLANLTDEEVLNVVGKTGLKAYTENTITDITELLEELESVRKNEYSLSNQEINQDVIALAVPIHDRLKQKVIAVLVIAAPQFKMTQKRIKELESICKEEIRNFDTSLLSPFALGYNSKRLLESFD